MNKWVVLLAALMVVGCERDEIAANIEQDSEKQLGENSNGLNLTFCSDETFDYQDEDLGWVIVNSDGRGYTLRTIGGTIKSGVFSAASDGKPWQIEPDVFESDTLWVEEMVPYAVDSNESILYATALVDGHADSDSSDTVYSIVALSTDSSATSGDMKWFVPLEYRQSDSSTYSARGVAMMLHPVEGVVVIGMLNESLLLGEGQGNETLLENTGDNAVNFMAHFLEDGTLVSAHVLDTQIRPMSMVSVSDAGQTYVVLSGEDQGRDCSPAALAQFDFDGNTQWKTANSCFSTTGSSVGGGDGDGPVVFNGPENSLYTVQNVGSAAYVGTEGIVVDVPHMDLDYLITEENGSFVRGTVASSVVVARYDFNGKLLMAKRPDDSLNRRTQSWFEYPQYNVVYKAPFLLMSATVGDDPTLDESKPVPLELPEAGRPFIAAFDPVTLEAMGVAPLDSDRRLRLLPSEAPSQSVTILGMHEEEDPYGPNDEARLRIRELCEVTLPGGQ